MSTTRRRAIAAATVAVLAAGCTEGQRDVPRTPPSNPPPVTTSAPPSSADAPSRPAAGCSAAQAPPVAAQEGLPPQVAATRTAIAAAARACDYAALADLAQAGARPFTYSFGGDGDPGRFWRQQEDRGEQPLRILVEVLRRRHVERAQEDQHVWPAAFGYDDWDSVPPAAREDLSGLYGPQDLARFDEFGAYAGYRVGIAPDGEWLFFVAGD